MSEEGFPLRRKMKEARSAMRRAKGYHHVGELGDQIEKFLDDIAHNLSEYRAKNVEQDVALAFVLREMGYIAQDNAHWIYDDYGLPNPFEKPKALSAPPIPPEPKTWAFPIVKIPEKDSKGGFSGNFRDFSALKMFGYQVGKTEGWPASKRREFLTQFMELDLPPQVVAIFGSEYGAKMSTNRLRKVANLLAQNASLRYRMDKRIYEHAIADWEDDLKFLKETYYEGAGLKFQPWPSSRG